VVQATGKSQFGGVHDGFFSAAYQDPGENIAPVVAAAPQARRKVPKRKRSMGRLLCRPR
jgi:2-methylcitrate dehydratase PrpD